MGQRGDQANALSALFKAYITGRAACAVGQLRQGKAPCQLILQVTQGPILPHTILCTQIAHRHHFDEGEIHATRGAEVCEIEQFIFVEIFQSHRI